MSFPGAWVNRCLDVCGRERAVSTVVIQTCMASEQLNGMISNNPSKNLWTCPFVYVCWA